MNFSLRSKELTLFEQLHQFDDEQMKSNSKHSSHLVSKAKLKLSQKDSKKTVYDIQPRVTRRMHKILSKKIQIEKCSICLSEFEEEYAILKCKHKFCLNCVLTWWKTQSRCPYCREEFTEVNTNHNKTIFFEDLPEEEIKGDIDFIPHCQMCWGEIEECEEMKICTHCRNVYWHVRCLGFYARKWQCSECAELENEEERSAQMQLEERQENQDDLR